MDANIRVEYQSDFGGGMNAGVHPAFIQPNQVADGKNARFRGRKPHPRYPVYAQTLQSNDSAALPWYRSEIYQGGIDYHRSDGDYQVHVVGGRVFVLQDQGAYWFVFDVTPDGGNLRYASLVWLCQADRFIIIQDGQNVPIVVDGLTAFRVGGKNPIPIGTVMAYGNGRLWLAIDDQLLAGDLAGSETDAPLKFSETLYLNEGGSFKMPRKIVGMKFIPSQDTATGQGTLLIHCRGYGIVSINTLAPRDQWKDIPIVQITTLDISGSGQRQLCNVNGDQFYHADDGWRSYRQARAQIAGWNQVPLSTEVDPYLRDEVPELFNFISAVYWDNRLLMTNQPYVNNARAACMGVLSLDFHPVSTGFGGSTTPAWDGQWTLPGPVCELLSGLFAGRKRAFAVCIVGSQNTLYEFSKNGFSDNDTTPIAWEFTPRRLLFDDPRGVMVKTLCAGGDFRTANRVQTTTTALQYRPDDACAWNDWNVLGQPETGQVGNCGTENTCSIPCPTCYYTPRLVLNEPQDTKDSVTNRYSAQFYDFQPRFKISGWLRFESFRFQATVTEDIDQKNELV